MIDINGSGDIQNLDGLVDICCGTKFTFIVAFGLPANPSVIVSTIKLI